MQPFSAVAFVLGLVGSLEKTLRVLADLHPILLWNERKGTSKHWEWIEASITRFTRDEEQPPRM